MKNEELVAPPRKYGGVILNVFAVAALFAYLGCIFLLTETFFGVYIGVKLWFAMTLAVFAILLGAAYAFRDVLPKINERAFGASILATLALLIVLEGAHAILAAAALPPAAKTGYNRERDSNYLIGEYYPRTYFPGETNFRLYKPESSITASSFGTFYDREMLRSPTLVDTTLERRTVTIDINDLGFRETESINDASVFALGDSMTFGWGVNAEKSWVKLLQGMLSTPVYNLGVSAASPRQEVELLKHLLGTDVGPIPIEHVFWVIYEGNDLEADNDRLAPVEIETTDRRNTVFAAIKDIPVSIRRQSVVTRFRTGELRLRFQKDWIAPSHWVIDGVPVVHPFFTSPTLGNRLFYRHHLEKGQKPNSYVLDHPNRPKLEIAFADMAELASKFGFDVTVVLAPTAERLHGRFFTDAPKLTEVPHFLRFISGLAKEKGFAVVDLLEAMSPHADKELYYFRDDDHWNEKGHALVANILHQQLAERLVAQKLNRRGEIGVGIGSQYRRWRPCARCRG